MPCWRLKAVNETLEARVMGRTDALREKMEELQVLNRVMLGREDRVLELKEEVRQLRSELSKWDSKNPPKKIISTILNEKQALFRLL